MNKGNALTGGAEADRSSKSQVSQVAQLFARLQQEIEEAKPGNAIHFIVNFLCKHYPEHLKGFASVWNADPELERERLLVVEFFKAQKLPTDIASHFTSAGFDTVGLNRAHFHRASLLFPVLFLSVLIFVKKVNLFTRLCFGALLQLETLCTLTAESLDDIEKFNQTRWLPGHKVRLQQTFADIAGRVRAFTEERDYLIRAASGYCPHPQLVSKQSLMPLQQTAFTPAFPSTGCNNGTVIQSPLTYRPQPHTTLYSPRSSPPVITYSTEVPRN